MAGVGAKSILTLPTRRIASQTACRSKSEWATGSCTTRTPLSPRSPAPNREPAERPRNPSGASLFLLPLPRPSFPRSLPWSLIWYGDLRPSASRKSSISPRKGTGAYPFPLRGKVGMGVIDHSAAQTHPNQPPAPLQTEGALPNNYGNYRLSNERVEVRVARQILSTSCFTSLRGRPAGPAGRHIFPRHTPQPCHLHWSRHRGWTACPRRYPYRRLRR